MHLTKKDRKKKKKDAGEELLYQDEEEEGGRGQAGVSQEQAQWGVGSQVPIRPIFF